MGSDPYLDAFRGRAHNAHPRCGLSSLYHVEMAVYAEDDKRACGAFHQPEVLDGRAGGRLCRPRRG
ncbi:MAG: hypothetical protein QN210_12110 [Armatimonadota bacterium]|nr:hypothetical protein [Armatimonadota bacterium]